MPRFSVTNNSDRRQPIRSDAGVTYLNPGETRPLDMQPSLKRYYDKVAHFDIAGGEKADKAGAGGQQQQRALTDLNEAELRDIAEKEKIDLGDTDLGTDDGRKTAAAIIAEFRRVYESGTAEHLRGEAEKLEGVDKEALAAATTKYALANLIIATRGIAAD